MQRNKHKQQKLFWLSHRLQVTTFGQDITWA